MGSICDKNYTLIVYICYIYVINIIIFGNVCFVFALYYVAGLFAIFHSAYGPGICICTQLCVPRQAVLFLSLRCNSYHSHEYFIFKCDSVADQRYIGGVGFGMFMDGLS